MATTYTVIESSTGNVIARGLSVAQAAGEILTDDGAEFEIREESWQGKPIFELWTRKQVANKPWTKTVLFSIADTREAAKAEIFAAVIEARWPRHPEAMTDQQYDRMLAEITADEE